VTTPSVLFVCVHNAGRSQMAAGWLAHLAGDTIEVRSAGSLPADQVDPAAVVAMAEVGIDISEQAPSSSPPTRSRPGYAASWASWRPGRRPTHGDRRRTSAAPRRASCWPAVPGPARAGTAVVDTDVPGDQGDADMARSTFPVPLDDSTAHTVFSPPSDRQPWAWERSAIR